MYLHELKLVRCLWPAGHRERGQGTGCLACGWEAPSHGMWSEPSEVGLKRLPAPWPATRTVPHGASAVSGWELGPPRGRRERGQEAVPGTEPCHPWTPSKRPHEMCPRAGGGGGSAQPEPAQGQAQGHRVTRLPPGSARRRPALTPAGPSRGLSGLPTARPGPGPLAPRPPCERSSRWGSGRGGKRLPRGGG